MTKAKGLPLGHGKNNLKRQIVYNATNLLVG